MAPSYIEARLDWLIEKSGIVHGPPHRRLNAIETMLTNLARSPRPIDPATQLRMCEATRTQLLAWIGTEPPTGDLVARLVVYRSDAVVIDASVPEGWIRILQRIGSAS
ncbi:MAG: hypothetical protein JWM95_543 [Gemmatimonadetes bacterium]|nr:hypothetical protein [Gemmatimonadota bacterium]